MSSSRADLIGIALVEFARGGYAGTSIQNIADAAGLSKSSVLYHFASKEALLDASLSPAIDAIGDLLSVPEIVFDSTGSRPEFIERFVDLLLEHRLAVHIFINQSRGLNDVPVVSRASEIVARLSSHFSTSPLSTTDKVRFGIALGGAAYLLTVSEDHDTSMGEFIELRSGLITVLTELLTPLPITARSE